MTPSADQVGGMVRAIVPMLLTMGASFGLMDKTTAEAISEPAIALVISIGAVATLGAAAWSAYANQRSQIVKSTAAIDPKNIQVIVGPNAPPEVRAVAVDPAVPNVVPEKK
jgi:hypothetical protein